MAFATNVLDVFELQKLLTSN